MAEKTDICSVCGRVLPSKHAVAGCCEADGCARLFCSLHWNNGNRRCPGHGWKPGGILAEDGSDKGEAAAIHHEYDSISDNEPSCTDGSPDSEESKMENGNESGKELCERAAKELPGRRQVLQETERRELRAPRRRTEKKVFISGAEYPFHIG